MEISDELVKLVAVILPFALPAAIIWLVMHYRHERRKLEVAGQRNPAMDALVKHTQELEERVRNLETIVCSGDAPTQSSWNRIADANRFAVSDSARIASQHSPASDDGHGEEHAEVRQVGQRIP